MRAVLISVAILLMCGPMPAQQRKQPAIVQRTFVPNEPLPCIAFNRMASRLDVIYKTEEISKTDYNQGMKKYMDGTQEEGVDYFIGGKDKYQRISLQRDKLAEFIRWYAVEGGRGQMDAANTQCSTELGEREERYAGIYALRQLQDTVNTAMNEPKGSKLAPTLSFNFVRLQPITCTGSTFPFSSSTAYMSSTDTMANATPTIHCE